MAQIKKKNINLSEYYQKDSFAVILLSLLLFIYLVPGLFAVDKIFFDDASLGFSRILGVAQLVKNGEIPLWDPYTFTGARPYFAMVESPIYNILLYPLYFIANTDNINQSFTILYLIPYTFFIIISGIGVYFFTRKILKFHILAAFVSGFLYATSPVLGASLKSIHNTQVFAFIPWVLLFVFLYLHSNKLRWWLLSIL
ncbi:MAG: hypothetical protein JXB50_16800, partial [Spirochaetes bacterium]|nr:hypothetical protein [Spirochaetota bacterium]